MLSFASHLSARRRGEQHFPLHPNDAMIRIIYILICLAIALPAEAAMVRVVGVVDGKTIEVESGGTRQRLTLAGISLTDPLRAHELLRWTVGMFWVMVEPAPGGNGVLVYRSPDALFVNRELVLRGYAKATIAGIEPDHRLAVTYLGELDQPDLRPERGVTAGRKRTYSGTSRRSPGQPRRSSPAGRASGSGRRSASSARSPEPRR